MSRKRRGRSEGSIYQRADGLWVAAKSCGYDRQGKRVRKVGYGASKQESLDALGKLLHDASLDLSGSSEKLRLDDYLQQWLEAVVKPNRARKTYECYEGVIRKHIRDRIGGTQLKKVTTDHVAGLYAAMKTAGCSERMRQLAHAVLHRAFQVAVESRPPKMAFNPCDYVEAPRIPKNKVHRVEPFTREEITRLFVAAEGCRLRALIILAVLTALRQGELFSLYWPDVNLEAGYLCVQHSLEEVIVKTPGRERGELHMAIKETKSGRSRRVDLPEFAVEVLWKHKAAMLAEGHIDGTVFCDTEGGWLRKSNFTRYVWKPLLKKAGLPNRRFHDLRHTSASFMLELGVHPKIVQERLGHSQISVTLDTYSHVAPTLQREAADKLGGLFRNQA